MELFVDCRRKIDICRLGKGSAHIDYAACLPRYGVRVGNICSNFAAHSHRFAKPRVVLLRCRHSVFEQCHCRYQLEGRARVYRDTDSVVLLLDAGCAVAFEVCHSQNVARGTLHNDSCTPNGILRYELLLQGVVRYILNIDIERRDNIVTILRLDISAVIDSNLEARGDALHQLHSVTTCQSITHSRLDTVGTMMLQTTDCSQCNIALRIDTIVVILGSIGYTLAQKRAVFDNLPLVGIYISEDAKISHSLIYGCRLLGNHPLILPELPLRRCDSLGVALVVDKFLIVADEFVVVLRLALIPQYGRECLGELGRPLLIRLQSHFAETVATKVDAHGGAGDGCCQHLAIARENGTSVRQHRLLLQ